MAAQARDMVGSARAFVGERSSSTRSEGGPERGPVDERMHEYGSLAQTSDGVGRLRRLQASADDYSMSTSAGLFGQVAQFHTASGASSAATASSGASESSTSGRDGLPLSLQRGVESLSGVSMAGVDVHYDSPEPARLDAYAFARGSSIHLSPGRASCLPHEAWHIAQQRQGRVAPTRVMGFRPFGGPRSQVVNDDRALEREADVMGARAAARGEALSVSNEDLGASSSAPAHAGTGEVVQRMSRSEVESCITGVKLEKETKELKDVLSDEVFQAIVEVTTAYDGGNEEKVEGVEGYLQMVAFYAVMDNLDKINDVGFWTQQTHQAIKDYDSSYQIPSTKEKKKKVKVDEEKKKLPTSTFDDLGVSLDEIVDTSDVEATLQQHEKLGGKGSKTRKDRIVLECAMGQGVAGDLKKYMLYTAGFSTCTPIILFNGGTVGGLFHFAAGDYSQGNALLSLMNMVRPTMAWIGQQGAKRRAYGDVKVIADFIRQHYSKTSITLYEKPESAFVYLNEKDQLRFINGILRGTGYVDLTVSETTRKEWWPMDFGFSAHKSAMAPNLFTGTYKKQLKPWMQ